MGADAPHSLPLHSTMLPSWEVTCLPAAPLFACATISRPRVCITWHHSLPARFGPDASKSPAPFHSLFSRRGARDAAPAESVSRRPTTRPIATRSIHQRRPIRRIRRSTLLHRRWTCARTSWHVARRSPSVPEGILPPFRGGCSPRRPVTAAQFLLLPHWHATPPARDSASSECYTVSRITQSCWCKRLARGCVPLRRNGDDGG
jgi:hypothetical protein